MSSMYSADRGAGYGYGTRGSWGTGQEKVKEMGKPVDAGKPEARFGAGTAVAERPSPAAPAGAVLLLSGIVQDSIVDGPGLRLAVFAQGCPHLCPGCHNPQTHSSRGGQAWKVDTLMDMLRANPLLDGITLSGGEPFGQAEAMAELARMVKGQGLHVMTYTGYTYEQLLAGEGKRPGWEALLRYTDVLVDGPFRLAERSLELRFRGSRNQRLIDVPASRERRRVVAWVPGEE